MTEKICRLCLHTITKIYHTIEESMLKTLKLNPSISRETVICAECASYLEVFSNLKPVCETTSNIKSLMEAERKCSFCAKIKRRGGFVSLNDSKRVESLVNLLKQYIPEMNLKNTKDFLTCETCLETMRGLFSFLSKCLEVEEKINKYTEMKETDHNGQIELKDIQQFIFRPTVKLEIESFVNELEEKYDHIQNEYVVTADAKIKYENETNSAETIIKTEDVGITSELIIKTEDVYIKSEHGDSESFQELSDEYKITDDHLEMPVFASETTLTHKTPSEVPKFKCQICSYRSIHKGNLQSHLLTHKNSSEIPMFKCKICLYQSKRKRDLQMHLLTHKTPSEIPMFKCEFCSYQTKRKEYLPNHLLTHKTPSEVPMFKCELCSYQTRHKKYLPNHLLTHKRPSEIPIFKCDLCSFQTKLKEYLRRHLLVHKIPSNVPMFECKICSYQSKRKNTLKTHLLTHKSPSEIPMFKCDLCSYQTRYKKYLSKHLLSHERPSEVSIFKCDLCSYQTKREKYLLKHLLIHKTPSEETM